MLDMICLHCGEQLEPGESFCLACGSHAIAALSDPEHLVPVISLRRHARIMGLLWLAYGFLRGATALGLVFKSGDLALMWASLLTRVANPNVWMRGFEIALAAAVILITASAVASLAAALALLSRARSGRLFALVAGFLAFADLPLGPALGTYTLIMFLPPGTRSVYEEVAMAA